MNREEILEYIERAMTEFTLTQIKYHCNTETITLVQSDVKTFEYIMEYLKENLK